VECRVDHAATDRTKHIRLEDFAIDLFVELVFEIPDVFGHFVFDADKADCFLLRVAIRSDVALFLLAREKFGDGFIDQGVEDFRAGLVAPDKVLGAGFDDVTVLVSTATSGQSAYRD
jgi:hypothetical protein